MNKMVMEKKLMKHPTDVLYKLIYAFRHWRPLWKDNDLQKMDAIIKLLRVQTNKMKTGDSYKDQTNLPCRDIIASNRPTNNFVF